MNSQATLENRSHRYKTQSPLSFLKYCTRSEQNGCLQKSSAVFLFALQTRSVLLLPQLPPVQVSGTLQTVHSGSQEDDDTARHQLRGHPTHDSVGKVAVGLALQTHSAQLSCNVALWGGLVQGGLLDTSHLSDHEEGQHTLDDDALTPVLLLKTTREEIHKGLCGRVDREQRDGVHAAGRGDVEDDTFGPRSHSGQHQTGHLAH